MKRCYSRFHFHVLDYCQWLRMPDDGPILECLINKLNYGVLDQFRPLPAISNPNSKHPLQICIDKILNKSLIPRFEFFIHSLTKVVKQRSEHRIAISQGKRPQLSNECSTYRQRVRISIHNEMKLKTLPKVKTHEYMHVLVCF